MSTTPSFPFDALHVAGYALLLFLALALLHSWLSQRPSGRAPGGKMLGNGLMGLAALSFATALVLGATANSSARSFEENVMGQTWEFESGEHRMRFAFDEGLTTIDMLIKDRNGAWVKVEPRPVEFTFENNVIVAGQHHCAFAWVEKPTVFALSGEECGRRDEMHGRYTRVSPDGS